MNLRYILVDLGTVEVMEDLTTVQRQVLKGALLQLGLELMDDKKTVLIEKIKNLKDIDTTPV